MANHSEFGRAGPQAGKTTRGTWLPATVAALVLIVVACTETEKKPLTAPPSVSGPNFAADIPFNAGDKCIAADAFLSGFTNGVNDSLKLASDKLCVSNDVRIAQAVVDSISTDGGNNYVKFTGQNVACNKGDILFLQMAARVAETATSQRTDIGIWIGLNGGNARVGQCNHYNIVSQGIPVGQTVAGVTNVDGDQCGDMNAGDTTLVQLGKIQVLCQGATAADTLVHIGSCLGWTQPGGDQACPQNPPGGPNGFRWGTAPGTGSKCNCEGFNVPITVKQFAKLEVVKACSPSQIPGATFDLLIDGVTQAADAQKGLPSSDNVSCGGTTGARELDAGTNANPGKVHTFGEGDFAGGFTGDDYTTSYACVNRTGGASRGSGTSRGPNDITLQPNDDVICTFTNTLKPKLKLVKQLNPTTDGGKVDFTIAGASFDNSGAGYGHNGTTGFQTVSVGSVSFSETAHTGTSLSDYTTVLTCDNGKTPNPNNVTSSSVTLAAGDQVTCTFTNTRKPQLRVFKATVPTTDQGKFDFTIAGSPFNNGGNGYGNGEGTAFQTLSVGNVDISEAAHTGTTLSNYTSSLACTDASSATKTVSPNNNTSGTVNLVAGDQVTCTFTNTKGAVLKVIKATVPTTDPGTFDFTIGGTSFDNSGAGFGNGQNTGFQPVALGPVNVSEAAHSGTVLTDYTSTLACSKTVNPNNNTSGTVTAAAGDQITCTFTNTRKPEVKLVKSLVPSNDAGLFDLKINTTTFDNAGAGYGNNGTTNFQKVDIGNVDISELAHGTTSLGDYTTTLACDTKTPSPNNNTSGSFTVAAGDKVTCTFTNTRIPEVKLVKDLIPDNDAGRFDLKIGNTNYDGGGGGFGDGGTTGFVKVSIGSVNISETAHSGTTLGDYTSSLACDTKTPSPNNNTSGTITVAAGDRVTCTFTNTKQIVVKLVKALVPSTDAGRFDFSIGATPFDNGGAGFGNNGTTGFQVVQAGSVNIGETAHSGTSLGDYGSTLACDTKTPSPNNGTSGTISVSAGDAVTCTFTNTHKATITVAKACTGGSGATFGYSLTGPSGSLPGFNRDCGQSAIVVAATTSFGTYTINETTLPGGWAFDQLICSGGGANTSTTGSTATVGLDAGENVTCTYTNKVQLLSQIAPTNTSCEQFSAGNAPVLADLLATINSGKINTVSPGVFFYFAQVSKGAGQSVAFAQTVNPNPAGLPLYAVQQGQAFLYTVSGGVCTRVATLTLSGGVWSGGSGLAAGNYVLGVKFSPDAAKGLSVPGFGPGALLATHNYSLVVGGAPAGGLASVNTKVKP